MRRERVSNTYGKIQRLLTCIIITSMNSARPTMTMPDLTSSQCLHVHFFRAENTDYNFATEHEKLTYPVYFPTTYSTAQHSTSRRKFVKMTCGYGCEGTKQILKKKPEMERLQLKSPPASADPSPVWFEPAVTNLPPLPRTLLPSLFRLSRRFAVPDDSPLSSACSSSPSAVLRDDTFDVFVFCGFFLPRRGGLTVEPVSSAVSSSADDGTPASSNPTWICC